MNMDFETLGGTEITKEKGLFFASMLFIMFFFIWSSLGATVATKNILYFYIILQLVSLFFIAFDMLTKKEALETIDTVTIESESPIDIKYQILTGAALSAIIGFFIATTGQAFVNAYPFGVSFNIWEGTVGSAMLSGLVGGVVESLFFFSLLTPTIYSITHKFTDSVAISIIVAMLLGSFLFFASHIFIYKYSETSLLTVFFFGLVFNAIPVIFLRSIIPSMMVHFTNNFLVVLLVITKFSLLLAL